MIRDDRYYDYDAYLDSLSSPAEPEEQNLCRCGEPILAGGEIGGCAACELADALTTEPGDWTGNARADLIAKCEAALTSGLWLCLSWRSRWCVAKV